MLDRAAFRIARCHAERVYRRFVDAVRDGVRVQAQVLRAKLRRNSESDFGRRYGLSRVDGAADLARKVPVLTYEAFEPYIARVKHGDSGALLGRGQRVHMFALTSGTTDEPKFIPVTDTFLQEYRRGWNAFGIKALLDHSSGFLRPIVQISSRMDESRTEAGIPCGAITGLMAGTQKRLVRKYYATPRCLAEIGDPAAKYYAAMRLAVPRDVAFMITASPSTQLKLVRSADDHREQLVRDIRDGTLSSSFDVPSDVRARLRPRLRPDRDSARRLERVITEHGALLPRHYWNLAFIANWTGGTMGLYLRDFPHYFGDTPVRDIGLLASEGRITIPVDDHTPAGILDVESHYFEFIPRDEVDEPKPTSLRCHELEVGQEYYVLMSTSSGFWRYHIGDLVRVADYAGQAPVLEFLSKGAHACSLAGEKLTEHQVVLAMQRVTRALPTKLENFVLAPKWSDPPYYVLHAETVASDGVPPCEDLAAKVDRSLSSVNMEYAQRRRSDRLGPVALNLLPSGYLSRLDHQHAEARRKGNEQFKHRYLYCRPGEDESFPISRPADHVRQP